MKLTLAKIIKHNTLLILIVFISVFSCKNENRIEEAIAKINVEISIERLF